MLSAASMKASRAAEEIPCASGVLRGSSELGDAEAAFKTPNPPRLKVRNK